MSNKRPTPTFRRPIPYYVCADLDPDLESSARHRAPFILEALSVLTYVFVKLRVLWYNRRQVHPDSQPVSSKNQGPML
jgi:hypothetical protein